MDQPCKVANPARGQLNRAKMNFSLSPFVPENLVVTSQVVRPSRLASAYSFSTLRWFGEGSCDSSRFPRRRLFIYTAISHRVGPEFIGSRNCVPMTFTAGSPPAQGQWSQGSSSNNGSFLFRYHHMDRSMRASFFPHPLL